MNLYLLEASKSKTDLTRLGPHKMQDQINFLVNVVSKDQQKLQEAQTEKDKM